MKLTFKLPILFTTVLAMTSGMVQATQNFDAGNLALVLYQAGPGSPISTEYYVFNLGPAAGFRDNTQNNVAVKSVNSSISSSNIAADLASVFGPTWADDGSMHMMVVSTIPQEGVMTNGDPTRTIYYSIARTSLNTADKGADPNTVFSIQASPDRIPCSNDILSFLYHGTNGAISSSNATSGANLSGVRLTTSYYNNLSLYIPPTSGGTFFQLGDDPTATLGNGTTGSGVLPGSAGVAAAVDVFRVLNSTPTGTTLTSGSSAGNAAIGDGQYIGSITLDSSGNLKVQAVGAATGNYTSWAATNNVTGGANGVSKNGISNLVIYALQLDPAGSTSAAGTYSGGTMSFAKRPEAVTNGDVTYAIQVSSDLGVTDPWVAVTPTSNTTSLISYVLPSGAAKKFARLAVTQSAP